MVRSEAVIPGAGDFRIGELSLSPCQIFTIPSPSGEPGPIWFDDFSGRPIPVMIHSAMPAPLHHPPPVAGSARNLLVVDNDPVMRDTLASLLGDAGYAIGCAADGEAGWTALCSGRFDLLIADHELPRLTGLELLRRLRAGSLPLPVIMISAFVPWGEVDLAWLLRPGAVLEMPFSLPVLLAHVRKLLHECPIGPPGVRPTRSGAHPFFTDPRPAPDMLKDSRPERET